MDAIDSKSTTRETSIFLVNFDKEESSSIINCIGEILPKVENISAFIDCKEALAEVDTKKPDVLFLNMCEGALPMLAFLEKLQSRAFIASSTAIITISFNQDTDELKTAKQIGIDWSITKPLTQKNVGDALQMALGISLNKLTKESPLS